MKFIQQLTYHCHWAWIRSGLLVGGFLLLASLALAQDFGYQQVSSEQGLSQNSVGVIKVGPKGYLWLGTEAGLNRFDGQQVISYQYGAPHRRLHNIVIEDLAFDQQQQLYILGNYGVECLSLISDSSQLLYPLSTNHRFDHIIYDPKAQEILLKSSEHPGFNSLAALDTIRQRSQESLLAYDQMTDVLYSLSVDQTQIYCRDIRGALQYQFSNTSTQKLQQIFQLLPEQTILAEVIEAGQPYIGWGKISNQGIQWQKTIAMEQVYKAIVLPEQNRICVIKQSGDLLLLDKDLQLIKRINAYSGVIQQRSDLFLADAIIHQGHIWLGVDPFGLLYRSLGDDQFSILEIPRQPPAVIKNLYTDQNGQLFAYVLGQGIQVFNQKGELITHQFPLPAPLRSDQIFAGFNGLEVVGPDQIVLSGYQIFGRYDIPKQNWIDYYPALLQQIPQEQFSDHYLFYESISTDQAIVSVGQCLYDFDLITQGLQKRNCLPHPITLIQAEGKRLWVGTSGGLYLCEAGDCQLDPRFDGRMIKDLRRDEQGRLLLSTSVGFYIIGDSLQLFDQTRGLKNNYVYGSLTDDRGMIWLSTNQGLSKINPVNGRIVNYDREDGISASEFNSYGFWKASDGKLYFSGLGGITVVNPAAESSLQDSIPLVISGLSILDRLPQAIHLGTKPLQLPPEEHTLTFYFQDLLIPPGGNLKFSYLLEGFDEQWVETDQHAIRYPQLPPGQYRFRLKLSPPARSLEEVFAFQILPPIYQQPWFIGLLILSLLLLLFLGWQLYRRRHLAKVQLRQQQQQALEEERRRISRELHDNMGAHTTALISGIQRLSASTLPETQQNQLQRMQRNASDIMSSLRDTIWILNDKKMYLTEFADLIKVFALRLIGEEERYNFVVNEAIETDPLLEAAKVIHLKAILQEIIHNAIKHAEGDCIVFNIQAKDQVIIELSDNGKGFDDQQIKKGDGLTNIQWRAQAIQCHLSRQSTSLGTLYRLQFSNDNQNNKLQ